MSRAVEQHGPRSAAHVTEDRCFISNVGESYKTLRLLYNN